jgi:lipopolysaccharide/colanic/teichoic acid biosynthesis glycosyltransferase
MTTHLNDFSVSEPATTVETAARYSAPQSRLYKTFFKRAIDITLVILAAPIALPLVAILAVLAACDGSSPFFTQRRVGKNGNVFSLLKIRTMIPDAQAKLDAYLDSNEDARREWDSTQKLKNDVRITPIGKFLRKSSLDELPQLWNVLRGDMSLVGPRPMMEDQKPLYPGSAYYALRPGITGLWQISDRNESTFAARAEFDADYFNSLSLKTDLSILARTVSVVLRCTGY